MNKELSKSIVRVNELLNNLELNDACKIRFENADEAEIIGSEASYLNLLRCITNLLLVKNGLLTCTDNIVQEDDCLISYEIKQAIDEFSDCWLVNAQIT